MVQSQGVRMTCGLQGKKSVMEAKETLQLRKLDAWRKYSANLMMTSSINRRQQYRQDPKRAKLYLNHW